MKKIDLTPEQIAVVSSQEPRLIVRAGAGSGKTQVLVERYVKHVVDDGLSPSEILTITFTRKSAAEMKKRIVDRLVEMGRDHDALLAESGPIQTIHSFCERTLRERSVDSGIDPDFEVIDLADAVQVMHRAVLSAIGDSRASELSRLLLSRAAGKRKHGDPNPHGLLVQAILSTLRELRGGLQDWRYWREWGSDPETVIENWQQHFLDGQTEEFRDAFAEERSPEFFERVLRAAKATNQKSPADCPKPAQLEEHQLLLRRIAENTCGLLQLVTAAWRDYERELESNGQIDFVGLERSCINLIESSAEIQKSLQRQYKVVLLDEAQDLNPVQDRLLSALSIDFEMRVGDEQQSIYRFRQADLRLFVEKSTQWPVLPLQTNFRSQSQVLDVVDLAFESLWQELGYRPMARGRLEEGGHVPEIWVQPRKSMPEIMQWILEVVAGEPSPGDVAILTRGNQFASAIAEEMRRRGIPYELSGGSESFYTRMEVRDVANALHLIEHPDSDFHFLAVANSPFVGLAMDTIVLLAAGQRPIGRSAAQFDCADEQEKKKLSAFIEWLQVLSKESHRLNAWQALTKLFSSTNYWSELAAREGGLRSLANVRKIYQLAAQQGEIGPAEFAQKIRKIQEIRHPESEAPPVEQSGDAVKIMTIHKAKGLEFPVVILPETMVKTSRAAGDIEIDKRGGVISARFGESISMFHRYLVQVRQAAEREEELRLLYVGMTRAERKLCLVSSDKENATVAGLIFKALRLEGEQNGFVIRNAQP